MLFDILHSVSCIFVLSLSIWYAENVCLFLTIKDLSTINYIISPWLNAVFKIVMCFTLLSVGNNIENNTFARGPLVTSLMEVGVIWYRLYDIVYL